MKTGARVAVIGFGAIGRDVAERLAQGAIPALKLAGVSARGLDRVRRQTAAMKPPPLVGPLADVVAHADIVVEAATAAAFPEIATAVLSEGKILVPVSLSAIPHMTGFHELAARHGGKVFLPSGAMLGLDIVKAAAEDGIGRALVRMRLKPESLVNEPFVKKAGLDLGAALAEPTLVFHGNVREAALALPNHCTPERMMRITITAIQRTPALLDCDPMSLIGAVMQASQLGLEPDSKLGHAHLVPFYNKKTRCTEVQLIP
ncbi:MAG: recombinase RecT, partial [Proteobacteria bacterium]|nr:recombinase RecT [Pseudomonadota bacterium]